MPTEKSEVRVPASAEKAKQLDGNLKMIQRKDDRTGETLDLIEQDGYGEWPICTLCQPNRQVEPTSWALHQNKHTVTAVEDD
jgi:hypothetical protein